MDIRRAWLLECKELSSIVPNLSLLNSILTYRFPVKLHRVECVSPAADTIEAFKMLKGKYSYFGDSSTLISREDTELPIGSVKRYLYATPYSYFEDLIPELMVPSSRVWTIEVGPVRCKFLSALFTFIAFTYGEDKEGDRKLVEYIEDLELKLDEMYL